MELIIGGAYQGKLDYAREKLNVNAYFECSEDSTEVDFSKGCVTHLERFALACVRKGISPAEAMKERCAEWADCILIANDISMGVVPMEAEIRAWREESGRMLNYLSREAVHVHRLFLGIGQVIK
jgi:adenosyl cobinamide kinase/adenosyl cobinamide phosphate guanylyltransferase